MDAYMKNSRHMEVENVDDEVYYREMLGCTTMKETGGCATLDCLDGTLQVCQKPGVSTDRATPDSWGYYDYAC